MHRIVLILSILVTGLLLSACGDSNGRSQANTAANKSVLEAIKTRGELRVGVKQDAAPFSTKVGNTYVGFEIDLAQALSADLGIDKVTFVPVSPAERIGKILRGEVDLVLATMTVTRSRDQMIDFSIPYFEDGQMLLVRKDDSISSYLDLAGKKVGALKGTTSLKNMTQVAPEAHMQSFNDYAAAIKALEAGKIDAMTSDGLILIGIAKSHPKLQVVGGRFSAEPYGIGIAENQSDWRDALNDSLQNLWQSGQWQGIYDTWFGPGTRFETNIDFAMQAFPD